MLSKILNVYVPYSDIISVIAQFIKKNKKFFISTHVDSDADGIGAEIGLFYLLVMLEKETVIYNHEDISDYLQFMIPEEFKNYFYFGNPSSKEKDFKLFENQQKEEAVFLLLDNSEIKRSKYLGEFIESNQIKWFSIDHHDLPPSENIMVDPEYASTCEIIWDLYMYFELPIPEKAAYALYTGMVSDTGNFRYPKTGFRTHMAAGHLLQYNFDPNEVYRQLFEKFSSLRLKLISYLAGNAIIDPEIGYIITELTYDTKKNLSIPPDLTEGLVNFFLGFRDIRISILISETEEGELKASIRSIKEINVAQFAKKFNGGGHKNAAGLKISKPFNKAKEILIKEFIQFTNQYI